MTTEAQSLTLADIDLNDPVLFESGLSHQAFKILRKEDPISWTPPTDEVKGHWNLVKYEDVLFVSRHPEIFSSEKGITEYEPISEEDALLASQGNGKMIITMDPPRHVKMRRLVNKGFTPRAVAQWEPKIRETTNILLDRIAKKGESDFVLDVACNIPLAVICQMLGVPEKDWELMFALTNKVLGSGDPEYQTDVPEDQRGTPEAARITGNMGTMQMFGYYAQALMQRKTARTEDIISLLVDSEVDGEKLTDEDILWFCFLLILAGNETTRNAMSGGLLALYWKCPHLGCTVPWNPAFNGAQVNFPGIIGWFRCPCHGSTYSKAGIRVYGPAPRPMDTMRLTVNADGSVNVNTGQITSGSADNPLRAVPYA
ncbi:MAG: cytochrome P450 [Tepidiforma sp.]